MNIVLLGYGEIGHAMECMLGESHHLVRWDPYYQPPLPEIDLEKAIALAEFVIFCTPTSPIYTLAKRIAPALKKDTICMTMGKGLDDQGRTSLRALSDGIAGACRFAGLYGPMIAEEAEAGRPSFATVAGSDDTAASVARSLFSGTVLRLQPFSDSLGAAWCGVLKNVYAILLGMADELQLGTNVRGYLVVACLQELARIVLHMGGDAKTPYTLAGLGDLVTTGTSEDSHHHSLGRKIVRSGVDDLHAEGVNTLRVIQETGVIALPEHRLMQVVFRILFEQADPREQLEQSLIDL